MRLTVPPLGVSVYHLNNQFIHEVKGAGFDVNAVTAMQLEPDLSSKDMGFIRKKGEHVTCPRDGKIGAAFVDCLVGQDNVGPANIMLSQTWGDSLKDIIEALYQKCAEENIDPKRAYVWMCCLCNNQHRVHQKRVAGKHVPFEEFHEIFKSNVLGIGEVWSYMSSWRDPFYLTRLWCIFEIYIANTHEGVTSKIIMPTKEKKDMIASIRQDDLNLLLGVLSKTKIEDASASVAQDKKDILMLIQESIGYEGLNERVNVALIESVYDSMGEYQDALTLYMKALTIVEVAFGKDHSFTAITFKKIASLHKRMENYQEALVMYKRALAILKRAFGKDHPSTSQTYNDLASVCYRMGEYQDALYVYMEVLSIRIAALGKDHPLTAEIYNNIASIYFRMGKYQEALDLHMTALAIQELVHGRNYPDTATTYHNIGLVHYNLGEYKEALDMLKKALGIREKALDRDHADTANTHYWMEFVSLQIGSSENDDSFEDFWLIKESMTGDIEVVLLNGFDNVQFSNV